MIDIHSHILPDLDDGPADFDEACQILRALEADGVKRVVATPHILPGSYNNSSKDIADKIGELRNKAGCEGLEILPGAENYIVPDLKTRISRDPGLVINNGKFLLLELPMQDIPPFTEEVISSLVMDGYMPILAHPERNVVIMNDVDRIVPLVCQGALIQVNAGSILGFYGDAVFRVASALLKKDMVFLIASDIHRANGSLPLLSRARAVVSDLIGESKASNLVTLNPSQVISKDG